MEIVNLQHKEQTGNWQSVYIVTEEEVISMPDILTNSNASTVQIKASDTTLDVLPVPEMARITAKRSKTKGGFVYDINCQVDFEYQDVLVDDFLEAYLYKNVMIIGIKPWGAEKLFGSLLHPLKFSYEFIDGKKLNDGSLVRVTVKGKVPQKPVFIRE